MFLVKRIFRWCRNLACADASEVGDPFDFAQGKPSLRLKNGYAQDDKQSGAHERRAENVHARVYFLL
jgi:hypothetical protein